MPASTPNITGEVRVLFTLTDDTGTGASALAEVANFWARAVELGFFGPAVVGPHKPFETRGGGAVYADLACNNVPRTAFAALSRMISRFSAVKGRVASASMIGHDGQRLAGDTGAVIPVLPASIPFTVERPEDVRNEIRIEIEFRDAFGQPEQAALLEAFTVWDALVVGLGEPSRWPDGSEYDTHRLSPTMIEHSVFGYTAGYECFDLIVLFGLRLHQRHIIERITFE